MRNDFFLEEFRVVRNKSGLFRNLGLGKISLDLDEIALDRDDVLLQKAHQVVGDGLVDLTESRIGSFRNSEDPVKVFQTGLGGFS